MSPGRNSDDQHEKQRRPPTPAYRALYEQLRGAILRGQLPAGSRLPASRQLSAEQGVSRNTVLAAFDQLLAEGYIETRHGSGTYVARVLPDDVQRPRANIVSSRPVRSERGPTLSARGAMLVGTPRMPLPALLRRSPETTAFQIGLPALDHFPHEVWARLYAARARRGDRTLMGYSDPAGYRPLREQIAEQIGTTRGILCSADDVVIVSGSQQALEFTARILLDPGETAWMEDPGYLGTRAALTSAGARIVPVPVDEHGLDVAAGVAAAPEARMVFVTPSHQFPLGSPLSLERRLALIEWAATTGSWIVEDDYDNEFRYRGRPIAALQSIDAHGRVIYVGTFSKTMFPGLRLGYVIAPPEVVDGLVSAHLASDMHAHQLDQATMADFIAQGHYARHLRRMRILYGDRQRRLVEESARHGDVLRVESRAGGLHVVAWLPAELDDLTVAEHARGAGIHAWPLSLHSIERRLPPALLLGFAGTRDAEISPAAQRLGRLVSVLRGAADTASSVRPRADTVAPGRGGEVSRA
ncbi:PLP-dependent aminotransferase family protein [Microbacterium sp. SORGH_AS_0888]|uniref:MocR-like pyridoxine biosynthesis transcription factor PdxR n=1 Tax=Microbacterium sp. SORGH_AS_0888 TaxID=3041791 RepID=UPI002781E93A|nr:PLP-dependent aminotransferase family protein [Microbacterium sp. SORGH_AS_0888]MDQ1129757.1 GntR family transcriptional regulator/MocR family aminotransferase [Microbacterium sp. SORGH_AS_0888]